MPTATSSVTFGGGYVSGALAGWATSCTITQEVEYEDQAYGVPLVIHKRYVKRTKTTMTATVKVTGSLPLQSAGEKEQNTTITFTSTGLNGGSASYSVTGFLENLSSTISEGGFGTSTITVVEYS